MTYADGSRPEGYRMVASFDGHGVRELNSRSETLTLTVKG